MNVLQNNKLTICLTVCLVAAVASLPAGAETIPQTVYLENGIKAYIYDPSTIMGSMTVRDDYGRLNLVLSDGTSYILVEDIADPVIANKGDGSFHPMNPEYVREALDDIDAGRKIPLEIEVYILPLPRRYVLYSSSSGRRIFLSPGVYEVTAALAAFSVTHEFGHRFQNEFLPDSDEDRWNEYLSMRGILDDPLYCSTSQHANRPAEVFAEDFRFLFGSELANYTGTIENTALALPDQVEGLSEFISSLAGVTVASAGGDDIPGGRLILGASNYPNPFNPSTLVEASLAPAQEPYPVMVRIYDSNGSLVRKLYAGDSAGGLLKVGWDGRNDSGRLSGSGVYFYRIEAGGESKSGKMILLR